jgi:hypothetical protein
MGLVGPTVYLLRSKEVTTKAKVKSVV